MIDRTRQSEATILLIGLGCMWGASFLFIEVLLDEVAPIEIVAGRLLFGAVAVVGFMLVRRLRLQWTPSLVARMVPIAILGNILPFALISWGQESVDSGLASVLNATVPISTAAIGAAFLPEERFTGGRMLGLLLGFAGIIVLTGDDVLNVTDSAVQGQLAVIAAGVCYAGSSTYSRTLLRTFDPVSLSALQLVMATLLAIPLVFVVEGSANYGSMSAEAWGALLALGIGGTGIAYIVYLWLIEHLGTVRASLVTYIVPVVALFLGWLVLDESIGLNVILGAALIILGVASVMRGQAPGSQRAAAPEPSASVPDRAPEAL
jgi:drug/metabolite transporter (DMT)-like permease